MFGNLKLVLLQHRRFLAIFFFIVFLPSIILAIFGIRAIQNERYKLRHQAREQQVAFVEAFQDDVLSLLERNSSRLREISLSRAFVERDYSEIRDLISQRMKEQSLLGQVVIWEHGESPWIPGQQERPAYASPFVVPSEWSKLQPELARAEEAEFRRRNYSEAATLYSRILSKAGDRQVQAWILGRTARCLAKQERFEQALETYRLILADLPYLHTESGRPLGPAVSLQILDVLRSANDHEGFFRESLEVFRQLEQNAWSLDGDQVAFYVNMLQELIEETTAVKPPEYSNSIENSQNAIDADLAIWRRAVYVGDTLLPRLIERHNSTNDMGNQNQAHNDSFELEGSEVLSLILPVDRGNTGQPEVFLGSLILDTDIVNAFDPKVEEKRPLGTSLILRSTMTGKAFHGSETGQAVADAEIVGEPPAANPVFETFFPENFPPWKVEVYEAEDLSAGPFLYKNIFFWTILALLVILFLGSGLIIRTIVHEVNLLNLKSDFIASVSHEFKTPLTAMGAILERLLDGEVKEPQKAQEYYKILSHDSERLKRLVKNVLDFTKIEEGKRKYRMASLDVAELVSREVESFENENKIAGFTVSVEIADDIPTVVADEEAMSQALHNILDNAAKFSTQEKSIDLEVLRNQDTVEISVTDQGIGIPENEQRKIFEKFFRGKQAASVSPTGTGLGLTLVKHIMTAHGGDITIRSTPGEGSRVSLILPINKGE